jgi:hypothetical protein
MTSGRACLVAVGRGPTTAPTPTTTTTIYNSSRTVIPTARCRERESRPPEGFWEQHCHIIYLTPPPPLPVRHPSAQSFFSLSLHFKNCILVSWSKIRQIPSNLQEKLSSLLSSAPSPFFRKIPEVYININT